MLAIAWSSSVIDIQLTDDLTGIGRRIALLSEARIRQDIAQALQLSVTAGRDQLRSDLDNPAGPIEGGATQWTIGGTYASRFVRPQDLTASVGFASDQPRAAGRYLRPLMRGTGPVTKGVDLRLAKGRRGLAFIPSRNLPHTKQGNISQATLRSQVIKPASGNAVLFVNRLRGTSIEGLFLRSESRIARTSTYESRLHFLGVLKPGRARRRTIDLQAMLTPSITQSFNREVIAQLQTSLGKIGFS